MPTQATVPMRTLGPPHYGVRIAVLLGAALGVAPAPVLAEMQVSGTPNAVRIEARDAPLEEILAALNRAFGVHYQLSVNLDKPLSGTYEGSLPKVLTGILNGYNFILYTDNGAMAVTVSGTANAPGKSPGRPASSSAQVVEQHSPAPPPTQAPLSSSGVPVSSSGVEDVARKAPSSLLESVAGQSGAPNVAMQFGSRLARTADPGVVTPIAAPPPPRPSTTALPPRPSAQAPQPRPSTQAPQPRSSTQAPQPTFRAAFPEPRPPTAVPQPR
jgi:hypothetical protein